MKGKVISIFFCICLLLAGCSNNEQPAPTTTVNENTEVKNYPGQTGIVFPLYGQLVPEEVFTTTAEENGLAGELYMIMGTVEEYFHTESNMAYWRVSTIDGDVIVSDIVEFLKADTTINSLGDVDFAEMRSYYPMPCVGEYIVMLAEYQGMSNLYGCPHFIYADEDYMLEALLLSITNIPDSDTTPPAELGTKENPYAAGMYKVGSDLPAGEYLFIASGSSSGYVCASSDSNQSDIVENGIFEYTFFMTVADGQYLQAKRCSFVRASDYEVAVNSDGSFGDGMYRVGIDIPAGEYRLTTTTDNDGYWCIYNETSIPFDIEDNDLFEGSAYVTVKDGQYIIVNRCTATMVK